NDRKRARPASTWFGGMVGSASAFRVMASTTKILVNDVIISKSAGATESSVMPSSVTIAEDGSPSGPLISTLNPSTGGVGSMVAAWPATAGASTRAAAITRVQLTS